MSQATTRRGRRQEPAAPATSTKEMFGRQPPAALEAEMSLLGSVILDPEAIPDLTTTINRDSFYREAHGHIWQAVVDIFEARRSGDLVQITDLLRDRGVLDSVGGPSALVALAETVPSSAAAPHYAKIVASKARIRRLIDALSTSLYDCYNRGGRAGQDGSAVLDEDDREIVDAAEARIFEIARDGVGPVSNETLEALMDAEIRRMDARDEADGKGGMAGIPTGFSDIDAMLMGLQPGEMVILAARPSMGKTALALNLAEQIALGGQPIAGAAPGTKRPVAVFSMEMSKSAVAQRLLSARSGVPSQALRGGQKIGDEDYRRLIAASTDLKAAPMHIDDTPNLTVMGLRSKARRLVAQHQVECIIVDYLQLMSAPGLAKENRQVEVSAISRGVKALARELNIPIVCLSQLNRASESREGNRPRMSDLRESGSIEQDADVIMLLHREDYYHVHDPEWARENQEKVGIAEIIVAKQRNGPTGVVKLAWDTNTTRFRTLDRFAQPPGDIQGMFSGPGGATPTTKTAPWASAWAKPQARTPYAG